MVLSRSADAERKPDEPVRTRHAERAVKWWIPKVWNSFGGPGRALLAGRMRSIVCGVFEDDMFGVVWDVGVGHCGRNRKLEGRKSM